MLPLSPIEGDWNPVTGEHTVLSVLLSTRALGKPGLGIALGNIYEEKNPQKKQKSRVEVSLAVLQGVPYSLLSKRMQRYFYVS